MSDGDEKKKYVEEYSHTTEAINYILVAAKCPSGYRSYIDALVGLANGDFQFAASDKDVNTRGLGAKSASGEKYNSDWARDKRRDLLKWQTEENVLLFEHEVQPVDENNIRPKSIYRLHLLKYAEQVIAEAQKDEISWKEEKSNVIKQQANKLVFELRGKQIVPAIPKTYEQPPVTVTRKLRTAKSNIGSALDTINKWNFKLHRDNEKLINEIEALLWAIKAKGFYDDILDGHGSFDMAVEPELPWEDEEVQDYEGDDS